MPTGVTLRDARLVLFSAGERVLLRDGPSGLTSRAVTAEAGVAKGVVHRHFADFVDFLAALVNKRTSTIERLSTALNVRAEKETVADNLVFFLVELFDPLGLALVRLVLSNDTLRTRLRNGTDPGLPVLAEAVNALTAYLNTEQQNGRILIDAAPVALAHAVVGTGHLLFADSQVGLPDKSAIDQAIATIVSDAVPEDSQAD
jgi:AcrR family transcriptional regulator